MALAQRWQGVRKGEKGRGMRDVRHSLWLTGSILLSTGWVIAWGSGVLTGSGGWSVRLAIVSAGIVLTAGTLTILLRRCSQATLAAQGYLDELIRTDPADLATDDRCYGPQPLSQDNPWADVVCRVRAAFAQGARRLQDLEQTQTALEIRCQRAVAQAERIETILAGLPEPILAVDNYDELLLANRSAESLFAFDGKDPSDRALARLVHCEKLVELLQGTARRKTAGLRTEELEISTPDGATHCYRATAARLAGNQGATEGTVGAMVVLRDIGDQKALQKRNAEFVSSVSHEMKTPLAGIKAYVELLADGDAEDEKTREEFLGIIDSQADRLQRLVENLLNLARIEAGVVQVHKQAQPLNDLLEEALRVVGPSAEAKNIELHADLSPMYLGVLVDRDMLLQAAINLLSNAVKYTRTNGKITLRSRMDNAEIRFEVEDSGVGLSEADCERVFEKFYRVKKDKDMAPGTGLGLPLAKHIVEDVHGGRMWVESVLGKGSTFAVALPMAGQLAAGRS